MVEAFQGSELWKAFLLRSAKYMSQEPVIRTATVQDVPEILRLWKQLMDMHEALDQFFALSEDGQTNFVKFLQGQISNQNAYVLVAQVGYELVGYSLAAKYEYPPVLTTRRYAEIHDLFVVDDHRGKGIGRRLIEETVNHFFQEGITRVEIRQAVSNTIAEAFWTRMGFVPYLKVRVLERPRC